MSDEKKTETPPATPTSQKPNKPRGIIRRPVDHNSPKGNEKVLGWKEADGMKGTH
jgi:hypothetical protein